MGGCQGKKCPETLFSPAPFKGCVPAQGFAALSAERPKLWHWCVRKERALSLMLGRGAGDRRHLSTLSSLQGSGKVLGFGGNRSAEALVGQAFPGGLWSLAISRKVASAPDLPTQWTLCSERVWCSGSGPVLSFGSGVKGGGTRLLVCCLCKGAYLVRTIGADSVVTGTPAWFGQVSPEGPLPLGGESDWMRLTSSVMLRTSECALLGRMNGTEGTWASSHAHTGGRQHSQQGW